MTDSVQIGAATLYCGDCRDIVPAIGHQFDAIITDPPYGDTSLVWDKRVPHWTTIARAALLPHGSLWCFGSLRFFMETASDFQGWTLAQDCLWEKHNGSNNANERFRRVHEQAAQFYPASVAWETIYRKPLYTNDATARAVRRKRRPPQWGATGESVFTSYDGGPRMMRSVMFARSCHGFAIHETQKPEEVFAPLVDYSVAPGGAVLDLFAGSGTLAVVCNQRGIPSVSIEKCAERFARACERVDNALRQMALFA